MINDATTDSSVQLAFTIVNSLKNNIYDANLSSNSKHLHMRIVLSFLVFIPQLLSDPNIPSTVHSERLF